MQYDTKKVLGTDDTIELKWHGEPTMVQLKKNDPAKTEVNTGDVVEVQRSIAKQLLATSHFWTFPEDELVEQGFVQAQLDAAKAVDARAKETEVEVNADAPEGSEDNPIDLSHAAIDDMKGAEVKAHLDTFEVKYNTNATVGELKELLKEAVAEAAENAEDAE